MYGKGLLEKLDRLDEAFRFERSMDIETHGRHAGKLREELTLSRIERHSGQFEELDVEGLLAFAERWNEGLVDQTGCSWNRIVHCLRGLEAFRRAS